MSIMDSPKFVLFTFPDGTHYVIRTTLNASLIPQLESGCIYDMDRHVNIPISQLEIATKEVLDEYPEQYREESNYYATLRYGINEIPRTTSKVL